MTSLQEKILEIFSMHADSSAPALINLNCGLEKHFLEELVASHLSLTLPEGNERLSHEKLLKDGLDQRH